MMSGLYASSVSLCLGGESLLAVVHHRGTENTKATQRAN